MSKNPREKILSKLYAANKDASLPLSETEPLPMAEMSAAEIAEQIKSRLEAVRSQVYLVPEK